MEAREIVHHIVSKVTKQVVEMVEKNHVLQNGHIWDYANELRRSNLGQE